MIRELFVFLWSWWMVFWKFCMVCRGKLKMRLILCLILCWLISVNFFKIFLVKLCVLVLCIWLMCISFLGFRVWILNFRSILVFVVLFRDFIWFKNVVLICLGLYWRLILFENLMCFNKFRIMYLFVVLKVGLSIVRFLILLLINYLIFDMIWFFFECWIFV